MCILFSIGMIVVHNYRKNNYASTLEDLKKDYILLNRFYQTVGIYFIIYQILVSTLVSSKNFSLTLRYQNDTSNGKPVYFIYSLLKIIIGSIMVGLHYSYNDDISNDYEKLKEQYIKINNTYMIIGIITLFFPIITLFFPFL
jgi:hypothetical protein